MQHVIMAPGSEVDRIFCTDHAFAALTRCLTYLLWHGACQFCHKLTSCLHHSGRDGRVNCWGAKET